MNFGDLTYDEFIKKIESFHGTAAPGIIMGGFMVNLAKENIPQGTFFDVICETKACLPDAIQLLTPCSFGNGWLRVLDLGRFACVFYDKYTGIGIRIFIDPNNLEPWDEIKTWYLKLKPKDRQDSDLLFKQIKEAGTSLFSIESAKVQSQYLKKERMGKTAICPICSESYPLKHGSICRGCAQELPYDLIDNDENPVENKTLLLNKTKVDESVGYHLLHDITKISKTEKGAAFRKGDLITANDVIRLKNLGKSNLYLEEKNSFVNGYKHENEVVVGFSKAMIGQGLLADSQPQEGKINFTAEQDGLLVLDEDKLNEFNRSFGVICACLKNYTTVKKGQLIGGTRAIPLYISNEDYLKAMNILGKEPLFKVLPLRKAKVGILITGTEIYENLVEDKYAQIIHSKLEKYGCQIILKEFAPDNVDFIKEKIEDFIKSGVDLIIVTAGLSVDPDDVTLDAIIKAGGQDVLYGIPVLPGCMLVLAKISNVQIVGIPGGGIYSKHFSFDLVLPRLLANVEIKREDLARMGNGGLI